MTKDTIDPLLSGAMAAGASPIPIVQEVVDQDLQQLTSEELAEIELMDALWPQKELAAHLRARYGDGSKAPGLDPAFEKRLAERTTELRAEYRKFFDRMKGRTPEQAEEALRARTGKSLPKPGSDAPAQVVQASTTPHADRLAEIIQKTAELTKG